MTELDGTSARRLIEHLKRGTTPLDLVQHVNVGHEQWHRGCDQLFVEVEESGDSLVRFLNGYVGDGKTHFLGMLRSIALSRNWATSYVSAETTPFNRYDLVLAELVKNLLVPATLPRLDWMPNPERGGDRLFGAFFARQYVKAHGDLTRSGLDNFGVETEVKEQVEKLLDSLRMHELLTRATRAYVNAVFADDKAGLRLIPAWLGGQPVDVSPYGIKRKIDQTLARDLLRGLSLLAKGAGMSGVLVLLDEAERILGQTQSTRKKCYGVIRDLLDNADNQGGMSSSKFYIAATPDMFTRPEGFAEYEALRSRLANSARFSLPNLLDWRGLIIDLTKTPLPHDRLVQLGHKIRQAHAIARSWEPNRKINDAFIEKLVARIEQGVFQVSKLRMLASCLANLLEIAEQNREADLDPLIDGVFQQASHELAAAPAAEKWE